MFLATTSNQSYWKKDEKIIFLGEWCKLYNQKHVWQNLQHETLPYHWKDREKFRQDYFYCESLYEKLLKQLGEQLNQIHGVDHSQRYWRIVLGSWLFYFITAIYDRYFCIKVATDSKLVTNSWLPSFDSGPWVKVNSYDWLIMSNYNENYNLYLFSRIIQELKSIPFEIKNEQIPRENFAQLTFNYDPLKKKTFQFAAFFRGMVKRLLPLYTSLVPSRYNSIVFAHSYLSKLDLMRLQLSLGQMPYPLISQIYYTQSPSNLETREKLKSFSFENDFESLLNGMIAESIPTCYVEDYTRIDEMVKEAFPRNSKTIFTANFTFDEGLKFWMASQLEKGAKLITSQHGGGYGTHEWSFFESHEIKISDQYFSWGWKGEDEERGVIPISSGFLNYAKKLFKPKPDGSILWVTYSWPRYARIHINEVLGPEILSYLDEQECFLSTVSPEVHGLLLLRLYHVDYGWNELERWVDIDPTLNLDRGDQTMYQQLNKSRICISTTNSTVYLETFAANFPTLLFWNPNVREVRKSAQPYFDDLRRVGVLHDTPECAAAKLNKIFKDPMSWWSSPEIQEVKDKFCHKFARTSDELLTQWKEELLRITVAK